MSTKTPACLMSPRELERLRLVATERTVLELGSWQGRTTALLAQVAHSVWSIDHHYGDNFTGPADTLTAYFSYLENTGQRSKVVSVVGFFEEVLPMLQSRGFDLVLVDGAHDRESMTFQLLQALRLCRPEGVIAVHDYGHYEVAEACELCYLFDPDLTDSLALYRLA